MLKKVLIASVACLLILMPVKGQNMFKINQYNIYMNKVFSPIGTLFANHQLNERWSVATYFYVNATPWTTQATNPSWGEGLAGMTYSPVKGVSLGVIAGLQSNEAQIFRVSPIVLVNRNRFSFFGAFEFGGERTRWDAMGFYLFDSWKLGGELIRYYKMYAAGPRAEVSFFNKQPVTVFYSALWAWEKETLAHMFGIYTSFGTGKKVVLPD